MSDTLPHDADLVSRFTPTGTLRYVSPESLRLLGYRPAELEGHSILDFLHPDDREHVRRRHASTSSFGQATVNLYRYRCADGSFRWLETAVHAITDSEGKVVEVLSSSRDATDRVIAGRSLAESEAGYRSAFEAAPIGMAILGLDGAFLRVNPALCTLSGRTPAELRRLRYQDVVHHDDLAEAEALATLMHRGAIDSYQIEKRLVRGDGEVIWGLVTGSVVRDRAGLAQHFIVQVQDVTDRREIEHEIREERETAERANRTKTDFLSRLGHELRTPLNAIIGFSQVLQRSGRLDPEDAGHVAHVLAAGRHVAEIVNDLVDSTRVERGKIEAVLEPVDVDELVQGACLLVQQLSDEHGIEVTFEPAGHTVLADARRLTQVVVNLLSNAVKYNRPKGWVRVSSTAEDGGRVRLAVTDSGIGIGDDALRKVFQPFERLSVARHVDGSGLGLSVAASFVEAMDGELDVESVEGVGSTFSVALPRADRVPTPVRVERRRRPRLPGVPIRVLHVEDEVVNRALVRQMLATRGGVHLVEATDAVEAVAAARAEPPDVILLDLNLPDHSGEWVLDQLAGDERTHGLPVVVISASADHATVQRLLRRGVHSYLTKPIGIGELVHAVEIAAQA